MFRSRFNIFLVKFFFTHSEPHPNISGVVPSVIVKRNGVRIFKITLKDVRSFYADFTLIGRRVVFHFRYVGQFDQIAGYRWPHVFRVRVALNGQRYRRRAFGLTVPFHHLSIKISFFLAFDLVRVLADCTHYTP